MRQILKTGIATVAILLLILPGIVAAKVRPGSLDQSFGVHGKVIRRVHTEPFGVFSTVEWPRVALAPDGKIVVEMEWTLLRYLPDGRPDRSFGSNGKVTVGGGAKGDFRPVDLAIDSKGRVLVAGSSGGLATVYRFTTRGKPDQSFGSRGVVSSTFGLPPAILHRFNSVTETDEVSSSPALSLSGLAVDSRDRPVLTGEAVASAYAPFGPQVGPQCVTRSYTAFVARLTSKGMPDPGFNHEGLAAINWQGSPAAPVIGSEDSVIYGGHGLRSATLVGPCEQEVGSDAFLEKLSARGAPAASWPGGWTTLNPTSTSPANTWYVQQTALDRFGHLFVLETVAGSGLEQPVLNESVEARHARNGAPDTSFGRRGAVSKLEDYSHGYNAIATDSKGRVLLAGTRWAGPVPRTGSFQLLRLSRDGRADTSFGKNGSVTTGFGPGNSVYGQQVFVDGRGRILVAGSIGSSGFAIARYIP